MRGRRLLKGFITTVAVLAGLATVAGLIWTVTHDSSASSRASSTRSSTASSSASASPSSRGAGAQPSPADTASGKVGSPSPTADNILYYLSDLHAISTEVENRPGNCTGSCTGFGGGAADIGSTAFPTSYLMQVDANGSRSIAEFSASSSCTAFTADIGLRNGSSPTALVFSLVRDNGTPTVLTRAAPGHAIPVTADLTGVYDIKIVVSAATGTPRGSNQTAVWGDAYLTCGSGEDGQRNE